MECSTALKAADRSSSRRITECLQPMAHKMSFCTLTNAVSVEWNALYADWRGSCR